MTYIRKWFGLFLALSLSMTPAFASAAPGHGDGNGRAEGDSEQHAARSALTLSMPAIRTTPAQDPVEWRGGTDNGLGNAGRNMGLGTEKHADAEDGNGTTTIVSEHHGDTADKDDDECAEATVSSDDDDCTATTTPPAAAAPVVSSITAAPATSTATIAWITDTPATSVIYWGTANPLDPNASTTLSMSDPALLTGHSLSLTGLTASTTYEFIVRSANSVGTTTSNPFTFTTHPVVAPLSLSSVMPTSTTPGAVTLSWTTNAPATGTVFFGTTTPLDLLATTTPRVSTTTLSTAHSLTITGLTASTTYHFVAQSTDASNNTATSSDIPFLVP